MHIQRNWGFLLLAIFLVIWGIVSLLGGGALSVILGILAIAAGVLIFIDR
jgi:hypothetical protein